MRFDLIIVGGGLVGAGLAAALRQSPLQIALIDARVPSNDDPRLFGLNSTSCHFLKNLGIWEQLAEHAAPIHQVHVSRKGRFGAVRLQREDLKLKELGNVIPARHIEHALNTMSLPNVTLFRPAQLKAITQQDGVASLTLITETGEKILQSSIVIGADGTESTVRKCLNIKTDITDYDQSAIVTRTQLSRSHQHIAYERFTDNGAIAMLPLTGNECATIWSAETTFISELMTLTDAEFLVALQKEFGMRLGPLQGISQRHLFPLRMVRAEKMVDQCVFLLGNSAHTLHPIAAQGFNLALYEVATLVDAIMTHETFTAAELQEISHKTQSQQATSIGVSHRLSQLFANESACVNIGLQLGMIGFDLVTPLKKRFLEGMMGKTRYVPSLLLDRD